MSRFNDLTGMEFGKLLVIERTVNGPQQQTQWLCKCQCGEVIPVRAQSLTGGVSKSCGCAVGSKRLKDRKHGYSKKGKRRSEYSSWQSMKIRCSDPKSPQWKDYGGRGIKVCERWLEFANFIADMGDKPSPLHTIDRYPNNDGNYEPGNCRWATMKEQATTRRGHTRTKVIEFNGHKKSVSEFCQELNIPYWRVASRLNDGWSVEHALTLPKSSRHRSVT